MSKRTRPTSLPPPAPAVPARRKPGLVEKLTYGAAAVIAPVLALMIAFTLVMMARGWGAHVQKANDMLPGLVIDDRFLVDTTAYDKGRLPRRGDIVAFIGPKMFPGDRQHTWVKRIVGLPGDSIALLDGVPMIGGTPAFQMPLHEYPLPEYRAGKALVFRERLPDGATYEILRSASNALLDTGGPYLVPARSYFVLGDDRGNSLDSRGVGGPDGKPWYVAATDIVGRANYIYWSGLGRLDRIGAEVK